MTRRRPRGVFAGDDPRCDVALRQRRPHGPVRVFPDRRAEREIRDAAREVVGREQLLRRVERAERQQIDLTGERRAAEQVGRETRGRSDRAAEQVRRSEPALRRRRIVGEQFFGNRCVLQDAAPRVAQTPRRLTVVVGGVRPGAARGCRIRRRRIAIRTARRRSDARRQDWRRRSADGHGRSSHGNRRRRSRAGAHFDDLTARSDEPRQVCAHEVRARRQGAQLESARPIGERDGRRGAKRRYDSTRDGKAFLILNHSLNGSGRE